MRMSAQPSLRLSASALHADSVNAPSVAKAVEVPEEHEYEETDYPGPDPAQEPEPGLGFNCRHTDNPDNEPETRSDERPARLTRNHGRNLTDSIWSQDIGGRPHLGR